MRRARGWTAAALTVCMIFTLFGAWAEQELTLPDGIHCLELPDSLRYTPPTEEESYLWAIYLDDSFEMEVFLYPSGGMTLEETVLALAENGRVAELREIDGVEMLCYRDQDEVDGARCIGYVYPVEDQFMEITFWYGTNEAGEMAADIMETFRLKETK